jgi:heme-degrading monooxygenase HmoA
MSMISISVRHTVADYAAWRKVFDAHDSFRRASGATGVPQVFRDQDNPNQITTVIEWNNLANAQKFAQDPALAEAMKSGGVTSAPEAYFLNRV